MPKPTRPYRELIETMQFYGEPEVSWSRWLKQACFSGKELTELGQFLQSKLSEGTFIDMPCGFVQQADESDCSIMDIAEQLGIAEYIEVDNSAEVLGERLQNQVRTIGNMKVETHLADVLEFASQLEAQQGQPKRVIYISGLQPNEDFCINSENVSAIVVPYLEALYNELERASTVGDLLILNETSTLVSGIDETKYPHIHPSVALNKRGFRCQRTCPFNKVQVFEKCSNTQIKEV
jgi:hypothetical protein